ncbi:MAG: response regulator [Pseudomonadota bacterium]
MTDLLRPQTASRIAIIEDDEQVGLSLSLLLRARGFIVSVYRTGLDFLEALGDAAEPVADALLVDYRMPKMDGLQLMNTLRARGDATPAMMVTGYYSQTLASRAREAGFMDVIEKPTQPDELLRRLSGLFRD